MRVTRHLIHGYKQPNRVNTHARIKYALSVCQHAQNIANQILEQKKFLKMFYIECLTEFKSYPTG